MHRQERHGYGIFTALWVIKWLQVLWDAVAVSVTCGLAGIWIVIMYIIWALVWRLSPSPTQVIFFLGSAAIPLPIVMAGFSYSSKLAVISRGDFYEKLVLFCKLITSKNIFIASWLFFLFRLIVESIFVAIIPVYILMNVPNWILRILLAGLCATPVYSYLKMATFKFFLVVYKPYPLVREEYQRYYDQDGK